MRKGMIRWMALSAMLGWLAAAGSPAVAPAPYGTPKEWAVVEWTRVDAPAGNFALLGFGIPAGAGVSMANLLPPQDTKGRMAPRIPVAAINLQTLVPMPPLFLPYYVLDGYQPIPRPTDTTFLVGPPGRWPADRALDSWFKAFSSVSLPDSVEWKAIGAASVTKNPDTGAVLNEPQVPFNSFGMDEAHSLITTDWKSVSGQTVGEMTNAPLDTPLSELFTSTFTIRKVTSRPVGTLKIELLDLQVDSGGVLAVRGGVGIVGGPGPRPVHYGPHINEQSYETAAEGTPFTRLYEFPQALGEGTPGRWRIPSATPLPQSFVLFNDKLNFDVAAVALQLNLDNRIGYGYTVYLDDVSSPDLTAPPAGKRDKAAREEEITRRQASHIAQFELEEKMPPSGIQEIKLRFTFTFND